MYYAMPREAALELRLALAAEDYECFLLFGNSPHVYRHAAYCYSLSAGISYDEAIAAVIAEHERLYVAPGLPVDAAGDEPADPVEAV